VLRLILISAALLVILLLAAAAIATAVLAPRIERLFPPVGGFVTVKGLRLHVVDEGPRDAPALLLIHGASSNLRDMLGPLRASLGGRYRLIAVDRPGHGWSERGDDAVTGHATPDGQARTLGALLDELGVGRAFVMGHSFGAAVALALAVERPDRVAGLVLAAPASHPWPSGTTNWYNHLAATPIIGRLFARTLALPAGRGRLRAATDCVFAPNRRPERYLDEAGIELVLTPGRFLANSTDLVGLHGHVSAFAPRYAEIAAPMVVIAGGRDSVVSRIIHAEGLRAAVPGSTLIEIANVGHKPDYALAPLVAAAIDHVSGLPQDFPTLAAAAAASVANDDADGGSGCTPYDPPMLEPFAVR
jgi:pimeloyl-ACP methyl ester carboxylesterase